MTPRPASLITIAVLVSLRIRTWTARKFDKRATTEVNDRANADSRASRVNKNLLVGAESHANVIKLAGAARLTHYAQTLPWTDEGWRLLPTANYQQYVDAMRTAHGAFDRAVDTFVDDYPTLRDASERALGSLWNPAEYPSSRDIRSRFAWAIEYGPVPDANDVRVNLPADQVAIIERSVSNRLQEAISEATRDAWSRLYEAVERLRNAAQPDARVYTSTVDGVASICDALRRLNIADDPNLEAMRQRVEQSLVGFSATDLRESQRVRQHVQRDAQSIIDAMSAFYVPSTDESEVTQ